MTFGISYIIYNKINQNKFDESLQILNENKSEISNQEYYSLMIKALIGKKDYFEVEKILNDKEIVLMKRDFMNYIKEIYDTDREKAVTIFNNMNSKFELTDRDIDFLIENSFNELLILLDKCYLKTSLKSNYTETEIFRLYNFNKIGINKIYTKLSLKIYKNCHYNLKRKISKKKFNYILDGGNILLSNKGRYNLKSYKFLLKMMSNIENPLLIIHNKYFKNNKLESINKIINTLKEKYSNNIFLTPYRNNDDYYILLASLKLNLPIISNDNFRDHIFDVGSNTLRNFIDRYVLKYDNTIVESLKSYSKCIQVIDNNIYVPTNDGSFYKVI